MGDEDRPPHGRLTCCRTSTQSWMIPYHNITWPALSSTADLADLPSSQIYPHSLDHQRASTTRLSSRAGDLAAPLRGRLLLRGTFSALPLSPLPPPRATLKKAIGTRCEARLSILSPASRLAGGTSSTEKRRSNPAKAEAGVRGPRTGMWDNARHGEKRLGRV